jgi:hypothetical protein
VLAAEVVSLTVMSSFLLMAETLNIMQVLLTFFFKQTEKGK